MAWRYDLPKGPVSREDRGEFMKPKVQQDTTMHFFSQNVDAWGALEWFDRLAKAVRQQDAAVVAGNMMEMETCRNIAASSAMRLVRDYEQEVRTALSLARPHGGTEA